MFRKINFFLICLLALSISTYAQTSGMHIALQSLNTIPDTISSGDVYEFSFTIQNIGTEAITLDQEVGIMLSVNHDEGQLVGQAVHLDDVLFPAQTQTINIPAYQFEAARCGGGPALDIIVWPTVMKMANQVKDSLSKQVIFVSTAAFKIQNDFVSGVSGAIDINTTYSLDIHAQNIGLQPNLNNIEFFVQIDTRTPIVLDAVKSVVPVGDIIHTAIQSFKLSEIDKSFVFDNVQNHIVTIGARESGKTNATQKAVYPLRSGPFPVELLYFEAKALLEENQIALRWATSIENNNKEFKIEKLNPQTNIFEPIEIIASQGNSVVPQSYNITDKHPDLGRNVYRIGQIDIDGTVRILNTSEVSYSLEEPFHVLGIAPNPTKDNIRFDLFNNNRQELVIEIYGLDGRKAFMTKTEKQAGSLSLDIDISDLVQGMYIYKVSGLYKDVTGKFIKE